MYYVLNMFWSDFAKVLGNDADVYAKLAKAYICDPDAPSGKVLDIWVAQMRAKEEK